MRYFAAMWIAGLFAMIQPCFSAVDFINDIMPVLSRLGCNGSSCHGKADGQNGFNLSVFGHDPDGDFR
ncbi:uncharacterized protein METZ01_LOCUS382891, partial [marine metagenome]